jgi:hypothetical protein
MIEKNLNNFMNIKKILGSLLLGFIFLISLNNKSLNAQSEECEDYYQFEIDMGFDCWAIGSDCLVFYYCPPSDDEEPEPILASN